MAYWNRQNAYTIDKPIVAFPDGIETPHSVTVTDTYLTAASDGRKTLTAGFFVAQVGSNYRFLPRATVTTAASTGAATVSVAYPEVFVAGDVLTIVEPSAYITLTGTWNSGETLLITIGGTTYTYTSGSAGVTAAAVATAAATAINANAVLSQLVIAIANGAELHLYSKDGFLQHSLTVSETAASGTATIANSQTRLVPGVAVGTISLVNTTTKVITLTASASNPVPVGAHIGVAVNDILGVYVHSIDFYQQPQHNISPVTGAHGIYKNALPYHDFDIERRLPKLRIKATF